VVGADRHRRAVVASAYARGGSAVAAHAGAAAIARAASRTRTLDELARERPRREPRRARAVRGGVPPGEMIDDDRLALL
jgi:hypothetical protein